MKRKSKLGKVYLGSVGKNKGVTRISYLRSYSKNNIVYTFKKKYARKFDNVFKARSFNNKYNLGLHTIS